METTTIIVIFVSSLLLGITTYSVYSWFDMLDWNWVLPVRVFSSFVAISHTFITLSTFCVRQHGLYRTGTYWHGDIMKIYSIRPRAMRTVK